MNRRVLLFCFLVAIALFAIATTWLGTRMAAISEGARALEPRTFTGLTIAFVGTGGSYENPRRGGPAIVLGSGQEAILVDAGRAVAEGLRAAKIPVWQPRSVYLTSLLPESTVGLDDLLYTGWLAPRSQPLRVVGPAGTRTLVEGLARAFSAGIRGQGEAFGLPPEGARTEVIEVTAETTLAQGELSVRAVPLEGGPVPSCAYRFELGRASVALLGAAWGEDALVELARGARLLIHEAFFAESVELAIEAGASDPERLTREARWRTPLATAGLRARRAEAHALALVRLRPPPLFSFQASQRAAAEYRGKILIPEDGDEVELTP